MRLLSPFKTGLIILGGNIVSTIVLVLLATILVVLGSVGWVLLILLVIPVMVYVEGLSFQLLARFFKGWK